MRFLPVLTFAAGLTATSTALPATGVCSTDAMLVFDGSASMNEVGFDISKPTRIVEARQAMRDAMPDIAPFRRVGLLVYGPGPRESCSNIDLRFGPISDAAMPVIEAVDGLTPKGLTALSASVQRAAEALDYRRAPGVIVLVTDGNETCGGRPCALGDQLAREAADLTVHVIGFKVIVDFFSWDNPEQQSYEDGNTVAKCLADRTGGMYVSTETVDELADALRVTMGCLLIGQGPSATGRLGRT